jgi:hypothetical protein
MARWLLFPVAEYGAAAAESSMVDLAWRQPWQDMLDSA